MCDNFEKVRNLLDFEAKEEDVFYLCQIIKRRKENPDMRTGNSLKRTYCIHSLEEFDNCIESIKKCCHYYNARAYFRLNPRNTETVALQSLRITAEYIANKNLKAVENAYLSAAGRYSKTRYWFLDIDEPKNISLVEKYIEESKLLPENPTKGQEATVIHVIDRIPTVNGLHIVVKPFNLVDYKRTFTEDGKIHKDTPTVMYYHSPEYEKEKN